MAALDPAVEQPGERLWSDQGVRGRARARPRRRYRDRGLRRVQHDCRRRGHHQAHPRRRRRHGRADRRAVEPISARARSCAPVPQARPDRDDRRFSRQRLHFHAADVAGRSAGSARSRHSSLRRRSRRPHGGSVARCRGGAGQADLQISQRSSRNGGCGLSDPAAFGGDAGRRALFEFRRRPRLSVPMQLLHHHQCAGPQIALSHAGRRRSDRARQCGARHYAVFRHRRQFRPQPQLGAHSRPADRTARAREIQHQAVASGRYALPPHSGLYRKIGARRLHRYFSGAREHQSRNR